MLNYSKVPELKSCVSNKKPLVHAKIFKVNDSTVFVKCLINHKIMIGEATISKGSITAKQYGQTKIFSLMNYSSARDCLDAALSWSLDNAYDYIAKTSLSVVPVLKRI